MVHDAFISYSKKDKTIADAICKALENEGLSCWYAPRDVEIGADWDASIMEALAKSRVMILVWSSNSDSSRQVKRELAIALDDMEVSLIPFRTEVIEPSKLRYYLGNIQWLDASTSPLEDSLRLLIEQVRTTIARIDSSIQSARKELLPRDTEETALKEVASVAPAFEGEPLPRVEELARPGEEKLAETEIKKPAKPDERQRLAKEQLKAAELERQHVDAEVRRREAEAREQKGVEARQLHEAEATQQRAEADAHTQAQHAAAQAALNNAESQRKLRESARASAAPFPITGELKRRLQPGLDALSSAVPPSDFQFLNSHGATPERRFPPQLVAIPIVVLLIVVAAVAYSLWPTEDQNQPSTEAGAIVQTPTPELPTPLPSAKNTSESTAANSSPTQRNVSAPAEPPISNSDVSEARPPQTAPRAPISAGVLNGKALSLPEPRYPPIARAAKAEGTVVVQVTVDEEGRVISANAISGNPLLQGAAVTAARSATFRPTKLSGQPVKVTGVITYNFVLE